MFIKNQFDWMSLTLDYIIRKETKASLYLKGISEQKRRLIIAQITTKKWYKRWFFLLPLLFGLWI